MNVVESAEKALTGYPSIEKTEELRDYRKKISELSEYDSRERDVYLRKLAVGEILGPLTGFPEIDKVHLVHYEEHYFCYIPSNENSG